MNLDRIASMAKDSIKPPKRHYPKFYERAIPIALVITAIAVVALIVIIAVVLAGVYPR